MWHGLRIQNLVHIQFILVSYNGWCLATTWKASCIPFPIRKFILNAISYGIKQTKKQSNKKKTKHSHTPAINMTHPTAYIENIELLMHLFRWVRKPRNMANEYGQKSLNHSPNHPSPPPAIPNSKMLHRFSKYRLKYLLFVVEIYATVCRRLFIGHGVYVYT